MASIEKLELTGKTKDSKDYMNKTHSTPVSISDIECPVVFDTRYSNLSVLRTPQLFRILQTKSLLTLHDKFFSVRTYSV